MKKSYSRSGRVQVQGPVGGGHETVLKGVLRLPSAYPPVEELSGCGPLQHLGDAALGLHATSAEDTGIR